MMCSSEECFAASMCSCLRGRYARTAASVRRYHVHSSQRAGCIRPSGWNLQAALNAATPGSVIELPAGAVFTGNFKLSANPAMCTCKRPVRCEAG